MAHVTSFPSLGIDTEQWIKWAQRKFASNREIILEAPMIFIEKRTSAEQEAPVLARSCFLWNLTGDQMQLDSSPQLAWNSTTFT